MTRFVKHGFWTMMLALVCAASRAEAAIIDFEDAGAMGHLGDGYHGLNWSGANAGAFSWAVTTSTTIFAGDETHSGSVFAWSNTHQLFITAPTATTFTFDSFWGRSGDSNPVLTTVTGYLNGAVAYTMQLNVGTSYAQYLLSNKVVDRVVLSNLASNLLLDDLDVTVGPGNIPGTPTVPEPASLLVWGGMGLASVVAYSRRKLAAK